MQDLHGAASKADSGDVVGAAGAVHAVKDKLANAAQSSTNEADRAKLDNAQSDLDTLLEHLANTGNKGEGFHFSDLPEPVQELVRDAADRAESQAKQAVDPTQALQMQKRLESFIKNTVPLSLSEINSLLKREVRQNTVGQRPQPVKDAPTVAQPTGR